MAGQYEDGVAGNSLWETGDWDGNGDFDMADFVAAFISGGFEKGPRRGVQAVPEPSEISAVPVWPCWGSVFADADLAGRAIAKRLG